MSAAEGASADLDGLRAEVREFINRELVAGSFIPQVNSWMGGWDPGFSMRLAERGWIGMTIPSEYGGSARGALARNVVNEELLAAGAPVAAHWTADRQTSLSLLSHGTEEQKRKYLPLIAGGRSYFALGMSEPEAGSDLASVATKAVRVEGGWRLTGTKVWTSGAAHCTTIVVLARSSAEAKKHEALTQFLLDLPHQGVAIHPIPMMHGESHFAEIVLDGAFVPDAQVLGEVGRGWRQITGELAWERSGPERYLSTFPALAALAPSVREGNPALVGEIIASVWGRRVLAEMVAEKLEHGAVPNKEAAMLKDLGTEFERELGEWILSATEVAPDGVSPFHAELLATAQLVSPFFSIRGGTGEILREVIARELVKERGH